MSSWKTRMNEVLAEMLREEYFVDAAEVTGFEDYTYTSGYCETCKYETIRCTISYVDSFGEHQRYEYYGSFSDLISSL